MVNINYNKFIYHIVAKPLAFVHTALIILCLNDACKM